MNCQLSRRTFLAGAATASWLAPRGLARAADAAGTVQKTLDIHVHLFGVGDGPSGCRLSKAIVEGPQFQYLGKSLGLQTRAKTLDEGYVLALAAEIRQSGLTKAVVLAQDAIYDRDGKPDWGRTAFYVPNDYLLDVTARYPQWMIPGVSINPDRADALEELSRCVERGARVLKIHPPIQGVDLAAARHVKFFRRCADLKVVVMVHTGHEHSCPIVDANLGNPQRLQLALEQGCTVVACHCGTGRMSDKPDMLPAFLAMARKFRNLWGDTSVLGGLGRARDFLRLLDDKPVWERLLHGSDFPFPSVPLSFAGKLAAKEVLRLQSIPNLLRRDLALKESLGIGLASAGRAYQLAAQWKE